MSSLDQKIEEYLPIKYGYFVELGANDGISQSNTKYFELFKGWKGVLIEPYEPNFRKCIKNRKKSTKTFHAACVSSEFSKETVQLVYSNLMTTSLEEVNEIENPRSHAMEGSQFLEVSEHVHQFEAPARTLESILDEALAPNNMDLLSLDVEGVEIDVLKGLNHSRYSFNYICVETRNETLMREYLEPLGYKLFQKLTDHDLLFIKT
jgi:FkbM family methyltransferase